MANIDRIVDVTISLDTAGVSKEGFSTLLIVGATIHTLARVSTYGDLKDLTDDGYLTDDQIYKAAKAHFQQTPHPHYVKVGRRQVDSAAVTVKQVTTGGQYTVTVKAIKDGEVITTTYTTVGEANSTATTILTALKTQLDEDTVVNAAVANEILTISNQVSGTALAIEVNSMLEMETGSVTESIAETMAACMVSDSDWYGISLAERNETEILEMADWVEANNKLFGALTSAEGAKQSDVTNDMLTKLKEKQYFRTYGCYHGVNDEYMEAAMASRCFTVYPGGEPGANKRLAGITYDKLSETEFNAIKGKNGNTYELFRNIAITQNGKVASGEWIDVIRFRDWLEEEIKVRVFNVLINRDKLPYTDGGIAVIEAALRSALEEGQRRGGIAPTEYTETGEENLGFTISVPLASNIDPNTKASRILQDVRFTARLAGAIHATEIRGRFTYENLISGGAV